MCQMNGFGLDMMSNQVIFGVDMFGLIMEFWVLGQLNCKSVVKKERCWSHLFLMQVFKYFTKPNDLFCGLISYNIFSLSFRINKTTLLSWSSSDSCWYKVHQITKSRHPMLFISIKIMLIFLDLISLIRIFI